jgi:hypothetical protein
MPFETLLSSAVSFFSFFIFFSFLSHVFLNLCFQLCLFVLSLDYFIYSFFSIF